MIATDNLIDCLHLIKIIDGESSSRGNARYESLHASVRPFMTDSVTFVIESAGE